MIRGSKHQLGVLCGLLACEVQEIPRTRHGLKVQSLKTEDVSVEEELYKNDHKCICGVLTEMFIVVWSWSQRQLCLSWRVDLLFVGFLPQCPHLHYKILTSQVRVRSDRPSGLRGTVAAQSNFLPSRVPGRRCGIHSVRAKEVQNVLFRTAVSF